MCRTRPVGLGIPQCLDISPSLVRVENMTYQILRSLMTMDPLGTVG